MRWNSRALGAALIAVAQLSIACARGQGPGPADDGPAPGSAGPRTPWGHPDLQGLWTTDDALSIPVERPKEYGTRELLTDEEFAAQAKQIEKLVADRLAGRPAPPGQTGDGPEHWDEAGKPSRRTSLVTGTPDGRIPLTPEARRKTEEWNTTRFGINVDSWDDLDVWDRCITRGLPTVYVPNAYNNGYQIMQTPEVVAILHEMIHDVRIIPLESREPLDPSIRQWMGDSRGRWEGDTLVVETTNFSNKTFGTQQPAGSYRGGGEKLRIVERFKRTGDTIEYEARLEDPDAFTAPWGLSIPMTRNDGYRLLEYACHEGNYAMKNILSGARAQQQKKSRRESSAVGAMMDASEGGRHSVMGSIQAEDIRS